MKYTGGYTPNLELRLFHLTQLYRKSRYWYRPPGAKKNDFSWLRPPAKGKNAVQWASKWQNKTTREAVLHGGNRTGLGVNNGDVTTARRMTERQDNGLLSLFSVHFHTSLSLVLGEGFLSSCFTAQLLRQRRNKRSEVEPQNADF